MTRQKKSARPSSGAAPAIVKPFALVSSGSGEAALAQERGSERIGEPTFGMVKTRRAFEEICDQIRGELAAGRLKPGDRLPAERELAEQFGVSRTAVREALRSLEVAGIVYCQKGVNGGPYVTRGDPGVITLAVRDMVFLGQISTESLTEARIMITNDAIRLACERATTADLDAIEKDIDRWDESSRKGDSSRRTTEIIEFYRLLARATHNEVVVMLVDSLSEIVALLLARVAPEPRSDVAQVRRRILKHVRARDAEKAMSEMTSHLKRLSKYLRDQEKVRAGAGVSSAAPTALAAPATAATTPTASSAPPVLAE
ncbi:MAG: FadR/GntR family transcriptional regulator [Janthinobacterium lividum]